MPYALFSIVCSCFVSLTELHHDKKIPTKTFVFLIRKRFAICIGIPSKILEHTPVIQILT